MTLATLLPLALKFSIVLLVFALGLRSRAKDVAFLFNRRALLLKSLLAISIVMPVIAAILVRFISPPHAVAIMLVALALSPVPPILPKKLLKAGGSETYAISLLVIAVVFAIVWIPIAIELLARFFDIELRVAPSAVATIAFVTVIGPLAAGFLVQRFTPALADRINEPLSKAAGLLLLVAAALILFGLREQIFAQVHDGTLVAMAAFVLLGLAIGHVFGGPDPDNRSVLALSSACRHPGIALLIAQLNFPLEKAVLAATLLYLVVSSLLTIPYVTWRSRSHAARHAMH